MLGESRLGVHYGLIEGQRALVDLHGEKRRFGAEPRKRLRLFGAFGLQSLTLDDVLVGLAHRKEPFAALPHKIRVARDELGLWQDELFRKVWLVNERIGDAELART